MSLLSYNKFYKCRLCGNIHKIWRRKTSLPPGFHQHLRSHHAEWSYQQYFYEFHADWLPNQGSCPTCGKLCATPSGYCSPTCSLKQNRYETEIHGTWNKGLTKNTDSRIAAYSEKPAWNRGLSKESDASVRQMSDSLIRGWENGRVNWMQTEDSEWFRKQLSKRLKGCGTAFGVGKQWNKGLTKNTDSRLADYGRKQSKTKKGKWAKMSSAEKRAILEKRCYHFKQNKVEKRLENLMPSMVEYTGDGTFWVTFECGRCKNPDFVVRPFRKSRKVIELFGNYWHPDPEEPHQLIDDYYNVGVDCLVVMEESVNKKPKRTRKILKKFIDGALSPHVF